MHIIVLVGCALIFAGHTANAGALEPLLRAAGVMAVPERRAAPDFKLPDVKGRMHHLRDQRGKVVFMNFWATWCPPCRLEMPLMEQLSHALRREPFVMWAVNLQEDQAQVARFMTEHRLHFPALLDTDGTVNALYTVRGLPTTYLIDCQGLMVGQVMGAREWTNDAMRTLLAALLNDAACSRSSTGNSAPQPERGS
jgi:peroxiredoxin